MFELKNRANSTNQKVPFQTYSLNFKNQKKKQNQTHFLRIS